MRRVLAATAVTFFTITALSSPLWAGSAGVGDIHISGPMLRATPPNAPVAGGFVTIRNAGETDDTLLSAAVDPGLSAMTQLHEMKMSGGVMEMSEVEGGIAVPAGETVTLAPGGLHLMLMGLEAPLVAGDTHEITLTFEAAGEVVVAFPVLTLAEIRAAAGDGS